MRPILQSVQFLKSKRNMVYWYKIYSLIAVILLTLVLQFTKHVTWSLKINRDSFVFPTHHERAHNFCTFKHNSTLGVCTPIHYCPQAFQELKQFNLMPSTCGYDHNVTPIVCCVKTFNRKPSFEKNTIFTNGKSYFSQY